MEYLELEWVAEGLDVNEVNDLLGILARAELRARLETLEQVFHLLDKAKKGKLDLNEVLSVIGSWIADINDIYYYKTVFEDRYYKSAEEKLENAVKAARAKQEQVVSTKSNIEA